MLNMAGLLSGLDEPDQLYYVNEGILHFSTFSKLYKYSPIRCYPCQNREENKDHTQVLKVWL